MAIPHCRVQHSSGARAVIRYHPTPALRGTPWLPGMLSLWARRAPDPVHVSGIVAGTVPTRQSRFNLAKRPFRTST